MSKIILYKIIYGKAFVAPFSLSFRTGFHLIIENSGNIYIGDGVFFNNYCTLAARCNITIGNNTIFGENVKIYDHNHLYKKINIPISKQGFSASPIKIGKNCWIASNVIILKGVTIGDNCVIGAGCIVYKDVPQGTILKANQGLYNNNTNGNYNLFC